LSFLPESLGNLKKLFNLILEGNNFSSLPSSFGNLESLSSLSLRNGKLESFPDTLNGIKKASNFHIENVPLESLPLSFGELTTMRILTITKTNLGALPSTIGKLENMEELNLQKNKIEILPQEIGNLKGLKRLNLEENNLTRLPPQIGNLVKLERLNLNRNNLENLPEEIGSLKSLNMLNLRINNLSNIPSSIAKLEKLEYLNLDENHLSELPKSMGQMKLKQLTLTKNNFTSLPYGLWPLKTLTELKLENNSLGDDEKPLIERDLDTLRDYLKQRSCVSIFISHAVIDYENYQLEDLGKYLESQPEVYDVMLCEQDLSGNIDDFMDKNVPISDLVFFLGTQKSVFNSVDCSHELELCRKYDVPILPLRGNDVTWDDFTSIGLSSSTGIDYDTEHFTNLCEKIYTQVKDFHEKNKLFKVKKVDIAEKTLEIQKSLSFEWKDFLTILEGIIESDNLKIFHKNNINIITNLLEGLKSSNIDEKTFLLQISQLFSSWLMTRERKDL